MRFFPIAVMLLALVLPLPAARAQEEKKREEPSAPQAGPEDQMARQMAQILKTELDLSDDQMEKVVTSIKGAFKKAFRMMLDRVGEENPDPERSRRDQESIRDGVLEEIRGVLDEGQKKEFEVLVKEFEQRMGRWERAQNAPGADAQLWFEGEVPSRERLLVKAENVLLLSEDEKKVVIPAVDAVLKARDQVREGRRERRRDLARAMGAGAKEDEVRERLHDLRDRAAELGRQHRKAMDELREIVTLDQEARLVAIGILD